LPFRFRSRLYLQKVRKRKEKIDATRLEEHTTIVATMNAKNNYSFTHCRLFLPSGIEEDAIITFHRTFSGAMMSEQCARFLYRRGYAGGVTN
jgi:hypothetical protein